MATPGRVSMCRTTPGSTRAVRRKRAIDGTPGNSRSLSCRIRSASRRSSSPKTLTRALETLALLADQACTETANASATTSSISPQDSSRYATKTEDPAASHRINATSMVPKSVQTNSAKHARLTTPIGCPTPVTQGPASIIQPRRRRTRADRRHLSETESVCATKAVKASLGVLKRGSTRRIVRLGRTAQPVKNSARLWVCLNVGT